MRDSLPEGRRVWSRYPVLVTAALLPGMLWNVAFIAFAGGFVNGERHFTLFDDAMISMAYGRTLAETGELVWFPGAERVQGVTNPLWTVWMAVLHMAGLSGSTAALGVSLTGLAAIFVTGFGVALLVRRATMGARFSQGVGLLAGSLVPFVFPLVFWSLRGMEVGVLAALLVFLVICAVRIANATREDARLTQTLAAAAAISVVGVLVRLDFAILPIALGIWLLASNRGSRAAKVGGATLVSAGTATVLAVLLLQHWYFDSWLPNTYYLKVEGFTLAERLLRGALNLARYLPIFVLAFWSWLTVRRVFRQGAVPRQTLDLALVAWISLSAYQVWVGGDAWESTGSRYLSTALPLIIAVVAIAAWGNVTHADSSAGHRVASIQMLTLVSISSLAMGIMTNPTRFELASAIAVAAVSLLIALAILIAGPRSGKPASGRRIYLSIFLVTALPVAIVSVKGVGIAVLVDRSVGYAVRADADFTQRSLVLREATDPQAVIATAWAGAPGYYSERSMVDLLGKSDSFIANSEPRKPNDAFWLQPIYPGHNKWNYSWSIGKLRPDVALMDWVVTDADQQDMLTWGYDQFCLRDGYRVWLRLDSRLVDFTRFESCA